MALMPGLQINIGQQLKLTPQLQQSIKILQYSALEVQQTIATTLESNFMLEVEDLQEDMDDISPEIESSSEDQPDASESEIDIEQADAISDNMEIDCEWDEVYSDYGASQISKAQSLDDYNSPDTYTSAELTLKDKLYWQSDIYPWQDNQELISSFIIDEVTDEGFLTVSLDEILQDILDKEPDLDISLADVEEVLAIIQDFEPTGVAARDLSESLVIQLKSLHQNPFVVTATKMIQENFELLTVRDYKRLKKIYFLDDEELHQVIQVIQSLNPRPGREYSPSQGEMITPDLILSRTKNGFLIELNQDAFPRLTINSAYLNMASGLSGQSDESKKIKEQLVEAKGLIKSIQSRGETLLRVGKYIIERQARFFDEGEQAMQPMVLRDVAESLELHESTISRATNQKYMQTPRGTFELKYFFSTGVSQYGSEDQSAIAIKSHIKQLIEAEDPNKPLSDNKLMSLLEEKEINVARRTIAKYRESMGIPSSSDRKKLNKFK
ncbi:RNA polymerase factor sigma-54 [Hydrogenovibrio sp. JE_KL2]|uniref:RNA polymerase factor sigma-54 n=1 Tax=Hydrogenovibrio sp. JE_KL2 TaxID=2651188 RepID=UPI00128DBDD6|nr:RNA polymerase factor sigma-54 [Hydrogenovibrio sp. JE_KL2]MPQ76000.1 RNA polymerase factor sigma-54 [Hydrogenovibrio sp. JE_KL2]